MRGLECGKNNLRKFGFTMAVFFLLVSLLILFRHRNNPLGALIISMAFFICALVMPLVLKPLYIMWMRFALVLSWINTRIILLLIYYIVFTPVGLALRLFRVDLLDRKIDKYKQSYWLKKENKEFNPLDYEKQF